MAEDKATEDPAAEVEAPAAANPPAGVPPPVSGPMATAAEPRPVPEPMVTPEPAPTVATPGKVEIVSVGASALGHLLIGFVIFGSLTSLGTPPDVIPVTLVRVDPTPPKPPPAQPKPTPQKPPSPPQTAAAPPPRPEPAKPAPEPPKALAQKQETPPAKAEDAGQEKTRSWKDIASSLGMADFGRKTTLPKTMVAEVAAQAKRCWTVPQGWSDPREVTITLRFQLTQDGAVEGDPAVVEFPATPVGAAAAKAAMEAVKQCGPYRLPAAQYDQWQDIQIKLAP